MTDIGPLNLVTNTTDLPFSSSSSEPLTSTFEDKFNMGRNTKCLPLELELLVQFDKDNHLVVKSRPVDVRHIVLLHFPKVASLANPWEEDRVAFMPELYWINNDI